MVASVRHLRHLAEKRLVACQEVLARGSEEAPFSLASSSSGKSARRGIGASRDHHISSFGQDASVYSAMFPIRRYRLNKE